MLWKWWGAKESCDSVETVIYVLAFTEEENKMWKVAQRESEQIDIGILREKLM